MKTDNREGRGIGESASYRLACPGLSDCTALRDCPQILTEATTRCYNNDRSLFCGVNQNFEPYVCCPTYQPSYNGESSNNLNNPVDKLSGLCGKSLIQGNAYKKLGAHPFVARIGFKSKFLREVKKILRENLARKIIRSKQFNFLHFFLPQHGDNTFRTQF